MTHRTPADGRSLVVVPTYNEADNVAALVEATLRVSDELDMLFVDDNSHRMGPGRSSRASRRTTTACMSFTAPGKLDSAVPTCRDSVGRSPEITPMSLKWTQTFRTTRLTSRVCYG